MLVKAPYLFYFVVPLGIFVARERKWSYCLRRAHWLAIPIVAFVGWQVHVHNVNAAMPDWSFIPDYHKMDNQLGWYFGRWADRERWENWVILWERLKYPLTAVLGLPLLVIGLVVGPRRFIGNFMRGWMLGTLAYLLIFFPLIEKHDYYAIPFLAPIAFFVAWPLVQSHRWLARLNPDLAKAGLTAILGFLLVYAVGISEGKYGDAQTKSAFSTYYQVDWPAVEAGAQINLTTPKDALVAITYGGFDCRCPTMLFNARRNGWSIAEQHVSPNLLSKLIEVGATHYAILERQPLNIETENFLRQFRTWSFPLRGTKTILRIFEFKAKAS
jgi:hypothetical protein